MRRFASCSPIVFASDSLPVSHGALVQERGRLGGRRYISTARLRAARNRREQSKARFPVLVLFWALSLGSLRMTRDPTEAARPQGNSGDDIGISSSLGLPTVRPTNRIQSGRRWPRAYYTSLILRRRVPSRSYWLQFEGRSIDGSFRLLKLQGNGAFGGVFRSEHFVIEGRLIRQVAIKPAAI